MDRTEYLKLSGVTRSDYYFELNHDIEHGILGIATETAELLSGSLEYDDTKTEKAKINLIEEVGDIYWYIALLCRTYNITFDHLDLMFKDTDPIDVKLFTPVAVAASIISGDITDILKRAHFYTGSGKGYEQTLIQQLALLHNILKNYIRLLDTNIENIFEVNVNKLKSRYPEGFKTSDAVNRDLQEEVKAMKDKIT